MKQAIYLDYNATTPVDPEVADAIIPFIRTHYGNPSSSYAMGRHSKEALFVARQQVAELLCADPLEIVFTSCATESNNLALMGTAYANHGNGNHLIVSSIEHPAILEVCRHLSADGFEITYLPVSTTGLVSVADVEKAIRPGTLLISIMHANNEVGTVQPIAEIAALARKFNILFHSDAAQSAGKIETDVTTLGVDLLTLAGHKLYAPKGIGALFIKKGTHLKPILFGAGQEMGIRPGTENLIHIVALGKACEIARRDFERNTGIMQSAKAKILGGLRHKLGEMIQVNGDPIHCLPNTLSISFNNMDAHTLASFISRKVLVSTGSACHADMLEISPVLKAMNINAQSAAGTVRISTGKYTTPEEAEQAVKIIADTVEKLSTLK